MTLNSIPKKQYLKPPKEGYFEALPKEILSKIETDGKAISKSRPLFGNRLLKYSAAVCIVLFVSGVVLFQTLEKQTINSEAMFTELSDEALYTYLEEADVSSWELLDEFEEHKNSFGLELDLDIETLPNNLLDDLPDDELNSLL